MKSIYTPITENTQGLVVDIFRHNNQDYSNKGISYRVEEVWMPVPGGHIPYSEAVQYGYTVVTLVERNLTGTPYLHVEPLHVEGGQPWYMFGGTFVFSSDSRFRKVSAQPIPLHDRRE